MEDRDEDPEKIVKDPEKSNERTFNNDTTLQNEELTSESTSTMTKRQWKKLKKREKWLKVKDEKRLKQRAKEKEKRAFARANNLDLGPSRKYLKTCTMAVSPCKLNVTIDLSFDEYMIDKDIAKLIKQILRCYTLNRRAVAPLQFSLTNFEGKSRKEMGKHNGHEHWDVKFIQEKYLDIFPKEKIIYLTSESENILEEFDNDCIYVIGGLVDHNSHKGLCHKLAIDNGVRHGRLPLDKYLKMKARKVLTIDHVFEIILRITEGNTWQDALLKVLPERKNAELVSADSQNNLSHSQPQEEAEKMENVVN